MPSRVVLVSAQPGGWRDGLAGETSEWPSREIGEPVQLGCGRVVGLSPAGSRSGVAQPRITGRRPSRLSAGLAQPGPSNVGLAREAGGWPSRVPETSAQLGAGGAGPARRWGSQLS
jgi:hypothetical protein